MEGALWIRGAPSLHPSGGLVRYPSPRGISNVPQARAPSAHSAVAAKKRSSSPAKKTSVVTAARKGKVPREPLMSRASLTSLLSAVAIFLFIRIFLIAAYHIPSASMEPTLLVGDFLFVDEVSYLSLIHI